MSTIVVTAKAFHASNFQNLYKKSILEQTQKIKIDGNIENKPILQTSVDIAVFRAIIRATIDRHFNVVVCAQTAQVSFVIFVIETADVFRRIFFCLTKTTSNPIFKRAFKKLIGLLLVGTYVLSGT